MGGGNAYIACSDSNDVWALDSVSIDSVSIEDTRECFSLESVMVI
jgi:hypothetical protein